jgi:uncharacterized protein YjiS (DUF1127 family)
MTTPATASATDVQQEAPAPCDRPLPGVAQRRATGRLERLLATLRLWRRRAKESEQLSELSDRALRDLGISRSEAWREARKPFWRG